MKKRYPHKTNILLVNITRLGDMLQATPTIAGMKMENPECKITVLVEKQFTDVCHIIPGIDEVFSLDLSMAVRSLAREQDGIIDAYEYIGQCVDDLRSRQFDYCLNMSSSAYTALLLNLIGIKRNGGWTSDEEGYRVIESDWAKLFATSVFHQNRQFNSLNLVDVFRCSADVEQHPQKLMLDVDQAAIDYASAMIAERRFTNTGPLIAVQAGASQQKRQWKPSNFARLVKILVNQHNCRVVLVGTKKELEIIEPIRAEVDSPNVLVAAGKTNIPQLAAMLKLSDVLITGDTGPMHVSVAVGTPVVAMFLASAYGFETGPYGEGNIVLQPIIGCGPCNPNKACARPDCHDHISPEMLAQLTLMRVREDFRRLPDGLIDPRKVIVYRSHFDQWGFYNLEALTSTAYEPLAPYRNAYRKVWLDDLGGLTADGDAKASPMARASSGRLPVLDDRIVGLGQVAQCAEEGKRLIDQLITLIRDERAPGHQLGEVNARLGELDRRIEQIGYHHPPLGPVTRMFVFAKENISGTEALSLASQMKGIYDDLGRRCHKLDSYLQ